MKKQKKAQANNRDKAKKNKVLTKKRVRAQKAQMPRNR